jgi:hypothetical protein
MIEQQRKHSSLIYKNPTHMSGIFIERFHIAVKLGDYSGELSHGLPVNQSKK